jgi:hypothetical protein
VARSEDISPGGLGFEAPRHLAVGTGLEITLSLDTGLLLSVSAVVVRCVPSDRGEGRFAVGVRFHEIPALPRLALERFLNDKRRDLSRSGD